MFCEIFKLETCHWAEGAFPPEPWHPARAQWKEGPEMMKTFKCVILFFFSCQLWKPVLNLHLYQYILSYRRRESIIERGYISMTIFRYMQIILPAFPYQNHFQQALNTVESRLNANSKISLQLYICISLVPLWAAQQSHWSTLCLSLYDRRKTTQGLDFNFPN